MRNLWFSLSNRVLYVLGALVIAGLMAFAFYLQYVKHQDPCPLCMVQRAIFMFMLAIFVLATLQGPQRLGERVYAVLLGVLTLLGGAVAGRHIWLQHLPPDQVPACGPGLEYMLETLPMADVLKEVLHGSGECAAKGWTFLTLSIPEWSLLSYLALGGWALAIALRPKH